MQHGERKPTKRKSCSALIPSSLVALAVSDLRSSARPIQTHFQSTAMASDDNPMPSRGPSPMGPTTYLRAHNSTGTRTTVTIQKIDYFQVGEDVIETSQVTTHRCMGFTKTFVMCDGPRDSKRTVHVISYPRHSDSMPSTTTPQTQSG